MGGMRFTGMRSGQHAGKSEYLHQTLYPFSVDLIPSIT
jgi:hypothetical protein